MKYKPIIKDCKYYSLINNCCTNKNNRDYNSVLKNGHYKSRPRRCKKKFCPILNPDIEFEK